MILVQTSPGAVHGIEPSEGIKGINRASKHLVIKALNGNMPPVPWRRSVLLFHVQGEFGIESFRGDAENLGSLRLVAAGGRERSLDGLALRLRE